MLWQTWRTVFQKKGNSVNVYDGPRLETITNIETLAEAWRRVRANKGSHGGDGVTIAKLGGEIDGALNGLSVALRKETYRPHKIRRVSMLKKNGRRRILAIPSVIDRVAQTAAILAINPHIDQRMSDKSFGYRAGRSVQDAIEAVKTAYAAGHTWTIDADIECYFDAILHRQLMADLAIWIDDERVLRLLSVWLRTFGDRGRGIAQGAPISPLLSNIYFHPIDRMMATKYYPMVRYADDFVVLASNSCEAKHALIDVERLLRARGLSLNRNKTRILPPGSEFCFLGYNICAGRKSQAIPCNSRK
jgi:group II intron reverse transcriptase/maturase